MVDTAKVFVVLDPTCMEQAALDWGEHIAEVYKRRRSMDASMHVYCCINADSVAAVPASDPEHVKRATQARVFAWLERLVAEPRAEGIEVETEVEWNDNWRQAIVDAAIRENSSIVVKNMTQHSRFVRMVRDTADWTLIRECNCPVLLVKTGRPYKIEKVLVALKHRPDNEQYEQANEDLLASARRMADDLGATMHAVAGYSSEERPDRQRFADRCGLERNQITAANGAPEKVIADTAAEQESDLVILARVARQDSPNLIGNTARKVIDVIDTEVLVLPIRGT
jgi:universal stress protein E